MKTKNQDLIESLNQLLTDYQIYYQNLRGLHWNVKGTSFFILHDKYEELYNEAALVIDEIAERILMIGGQPIHTFSDYVQKAKLLEVKNVSEGEKGVEHILENSEYLLESFHDILEKSTEIGDEGTMDMISEWIGLAQKRVWMLKAFLN